MRTLLRWLVMTLGIAALVRWLRHRTSPPGPAPVDEDPAEELRRKLAETRALQQDETDEPAPESSVDERRAAVHAQGRATVADMTVSDEE